MTELLAAWARNDRVRDVALSTAAARDLVSRYVAGQHLDDLIPVLKSLVNKGLRVSVEYLGKEVQSGADAEQNLDSYLALVARLADEGLARGCELSIRLGWLGQELGVDGRAQSLRLARRISRAANNAGAFVTVDMSQHDLVGPTLEAWGQLHQDLPSTGVTLQAALYRTARDVPSLALPGNRVRLVKGAFSEPRQVAFRNSHEIDLAYVRSLRKLMQSQAVPLVATHDPRLVSITEELVRRTGRARDSYEFQMMYGIRPHEQRRLVDIGHPTRTYVPFGPGWYSYYLRRLAERPANTALFARSLLGKR